MVTMAGSQQGALKLSGRVLGVAAQLLLCLAPLHVLHAQQLPTASVATTSDTLRLYYLGYPIGWERYALKSVDSGVQLDADFDYVDRGRRNHVQGVMRLAGNYAPTPLEVVRLTEAMKRYHLALEVGHSGGSVGEISGFRHVRWDSLFGPGDLEKAQGHAK